MASNQSPLLPQDTGEVQEGTQKPDLHIQNSDHVHLSAEPGHERTRFGILSNHE